MGLTTHTPSFNTRRLYLNSHWTMFASRAFRSAVPVVWNSLPHHLTDDLSKTNTVCTSRSFSVCASVVWNSLPPDIQLCSCLKTFNSKLKTFLFRRSLWHLTGRKAPLHPWTSWRYINDFTYLHFKMIHSLLAVTHKYTSLCKLWALIPNQLRFFGFSPALGVYPLLLGCLIVDDHQQVWWKEAWKDSRDGFCLATSGRPFNQIMSSGGVGGKKTCMHKF